MATLSDDKIPSVVKNEWFYLVARVSTLFVTFVGIPMLGFMLSRAVASADEIRSQLSEQNITLRLLSSEMKLRFDSSDKNTADHELRLRGLERRPTPIP